MYLSQTECSRLHVKDRERLEQVARDKQLEDEFDIIEDNAGDQALISYYNDTPSEPEKVNLSDKFKQGMTNLGFIFTTNGSKKVNLRDEKSKGSKKSARSATDRISIAAIENNDQLEVYLYSQKFFQ